MIILNANGFSMDAGNTFTLYDAAGSVGANGYLISSNGSQILWTPPAPATTIPLVSSAGRFQILNANATNQSNTCTFVPFNGSVIVIGGNYYTIPSAGVSANIQSCSIDGTGGSALTSNTLYYAYVIQTANVLSLDFSTTGHSTSSNTQNLGIEIKTGDDTHSLVGMVYPYNGTINDGVAIISIASWFNRRTRHTTSNQFSYGAFSFTSPSEITTAAQRCWMLSWSDCDMQCGAQLAGTNNTNGGEVFLYASIDSTKASYLVFLEVVTSTSNTFEFLTAAGTSRFAGITNEGMHYAGLIINTNTGTATADDCQCSLQSFI